MSPATRLNVLRQRRQELLAASEAHRRLLFVECTAVQQRLEWLDRTVSRASPETIHQSRRADSGYMGRPTPESWALVDWQICIRNAGGGEICECGARVIQR